VSFCEKKLVDKLGALETPKHINIHILTWPRELDTVAISMSVEGVQGGDPIELEQRFPTWGTFDYLKECIYV